MASGTPTELIVYQNLVHSRSVYKRDHEARGGKKVTSPIIIVSLSASLGAVYMAQYRKKLQLCISHLTETE